jgi:2-phosphoglycolate phosphatase
MIKGVLFDLDGTLIDSAPSIIRCFEKTFADLFPEVVLSEEEKLSFLGPTLVQTFSKYTDDMDYVYQAFDHYVMHSTLEHDNDMIPSFPNAEATLKTLKEKGYQVGLVTSKKNNMARRGLENNDLFKYIDVLVGFDNVKNHKPAPDSLNKAAELLNLKTNELIYVGDHVNDIIAAKRAGMKSVAVEFSYNIDKIKLHDPDYIIKDLLEIIEIVEEK